MKFSNAKRFAFAFIFMFIFFLFGSTIDDVKAESLSSPAIAPTSEAIDINKPPADFYTNRLDSISALSSYTMRIGDIFTTNATSSSGIVGHSGIAVSSYYILHIPGPFQTTKLLTLAQWKSTYSDKSTWVHRSPNATVGQQAGNWAYYNYYSSGTTGVQNKTPRYDITISTATLNPTYCSKIVWQAYYYGTGSTPVIKSGTDTIIFPYSIRDGVYFNSSYKPSMVASW